jgi:hypothetical protein
MFLELERMNFIPKTSFNVTAMVVVVSWFGVKLVIVAKQTSSQWVELQIHSPILRKSYFLKLCRFWTRAKLPNSNKLTLHWTLQDRPKTFYGRTISMFWNDPQGLPIFHQLSLCRTSLVNVVRDRHKDWLIDWLIDYLRFYVPLKNFSLIWRRHHCRWRAAKFRPMLGAQGLRAGRDVYRTTTYIQRIE